MSLLRRKIKRAAAAVLSLTLCASLTASCALMDNGGKSQGGNDSTETLKFTDVTDKFDNTKLTAENFNSSVLEGSGPADETRTLIVTLKGACILDVMPSDSTAPEFLETSEGAAAMLAIDREQKTFLNKLRSKGIDYSLKYSYATVTNSVAIEVKTSAVRSIKGLGGVSGAAFAPTYLAPKTEDSGAAGGAVENDTYVHATGIYNSEELASAYTQWGKGEGTVVAVIDTGLDYTHDAFQKEPDGARVSKPDVAAKVANTVAYQRMTANGASLTVDDVYVSEKVPYAFDYADTDSDVYPSYSNHGTHVAGIIGGQADYYVTKDGEIAKDEEGKNIPFLGVAPESQLMIFKAFTDNLDSDALGGAEAENVLAALNDCVTMGVDVINMSLGSTAGFTTTDDGDIETDWEGVVYNQVCNRIQEAGISLICAASNDYSSGYGGLYGTNLASNPDSGTVGSPSTYYAALSVASINGQKSEYVQASDGSALFFENSSNGSGTDYEFVNELLGGEITKEYKYVMAGLGQRGNYSGAVSRFIKDNPGEVIAVVQRGVTTFQEKVEAASRAGAAGVIIYNNVSGTVRMSLGDVSASARIPAVSISMDAGQKLKTLAEKSSNRISGTVTIDKSFTAGPFMSPFSSWGTTPDLKIKPEITAHGGEITSTVPGGYAEQSGTSMAAPNMAGLTALVRSYVKHQLSNLVGGASIDETQVTRLANQLMMSTATIARDESNLAYSPRKQGAGLANLHNIITTGAYLYTDEASDAEHYYEGKDNRPKIELGDDAAKKGEYSFAFKVRNFGSSALTFTPSTVLMTETLASDKISVKEQNYPLSGASVYTVDGTPVSGPFTVASGAEATVSVKITLSAEDKKYLDESFKNGMYVEGFVTLKSSGEQCDLNLPFMGFYGDWEAAPMLDYSAFEISEFDQDSSYTDDTRPSELIWATQAYGSYNQNNYVIPLGSFLYNQDESAAQMYPDEEFCAVSMFNEIVSEEGIGNYVTVYQIKCLYAGLLRNAREVDYRLYDAYTGELVTSGTKYRISKAYANGGTSRPAYIELELSAAELGLLSNGKYTFEFDFKFNEDSVVTEENQFKFDFYVDYEAPVLTDARVRYRDETDSSGKTNQKIFLDLDVYDNHYAQSVMLCYIDTESERQEMKLATEYVTPVRNANKNGVTTVTIDVTDIWDEYKDMLAVQVDDYALNHTSYILSGFRPNSDADDSLNATTLPSTFELAEGEENITVGINEMHKVGLVYEGTANLSNFEWSSPTDYIAVKNGEIVGKACTNGKAYPVFVTNRNGVVKRINVTVTDTESDIRGVSFGFGTVKDYQEALVPATGRVEVYAGEYLDLEIKATPWYYDAEKRIESVEWRSSDASVATVENGKVHTLKKGSVTISAVIKSDLGSRTVAVEFIVRNEFTISGMTLSRYRGEGETVNGKEHVVIVPADKAIMTIGEGAFEDNKVIEKIIIPKTVTQIEKDAFKGCTNLKEVYFMSDEPFVEGKDIADADLSLINRSAFEGCTSLKLLDLSYVKIISVAREAFKDCKSLETIKKSEAIGTAYDRAFMGCESLKSFNMTGLHVAGANVFSGCTSLSEIETGKFTALGKGQFAALDYVYTEYNAETGAWDIKREHYAACSALENAVIKTAVVGDEAFKGTALKSVTFDGVSEIRVGAGVFEGCVGLSGVSFVNGATIKILGARAFADCAALTSIDFPDGLESVGTDAFAGSGLFGQSGRAYDTANDALISGDTILKYLGNGGEYALPVGVTKIAPYAFANTAVTKITNLSQVTQIGEGAFSGSALIEATLGAISEIAAYAFVNTQLTSVSLPSSVTYVGDGAFSGTPLAAFSYSPAADAEFGSGVFANCKNLVEIELASNITKIGDLTFSGCVRLVRAVMPAVTLLGSYTFWNTPSLTTAIFNRGATVTGDYTFAAFSNGYMAGPADRPALKTVTLGSSLEKIGAGAFYNCKNITSVSLNGAKEIGDYAFYNVPITNADGLGAVVTIGNYAFVNAKLQSLNLNSAQTIGDGAFTVTGGKAYTSVVIPSAVTLGINAFYGGNESTVNIPLSLKTVGRGAFAGSLSLKSFTVKQGHEIFFVNDGVLYRNIDSTGNYALVAYPSAKSAAVYEVLDGTAKIDGRAFEGLNAKVGKVVMPYSLKTVGERAFFDSGVTEYEFKSVTAPALESEYAPEIDEYFDTNNINFKGYYYANFENYFVFYSDRAVEGSPSVPKLKIYRPENGTGYDNHVYSQYFTTTELTETALSAVTDSFLKIVSGLPEASEVKSWTPGGAITKDYVQKISDDVKTAHAHYNSFSVDEKQVALAGQANIDKFFAVEEALRGVKAAFGINVAVSRLTYTGDFRTEYKVGETFDMTGLQIVIVYDDYSTENADMSKVTLVDPMGPLGVLDNEVTLSVEGQSRQVRIRITVTEEQGEDVTPEPVEGGCAGGCAGMTTGGGPTIFLGMTVLGAAVVLSGFVRRKIRGIK